MESWIPLFDIFLNSPSPEVEASMWLQQSFNPSSNAATIISTSSFLSLLAKPSNAVVVDPSSSTPTLPSQRKKIVWLQTLPSVVQSRILSFLALERRRFCAADLCKLVRNILSGNQELDFWVEKAAHNLLDAVSESSYEWISCLNLDFAEERVGEEFASLPDWLKDTAGTEDLILPWLPISPDELNSRIFCGTFGDDSDSLLDVQENAEETMSKNEPEMKVASPKTATPSPEIEKAAVSLKARILTFESTHKAVGLANEIRELSLNKGGDSFAVLGLIEPWKADDETASVLVSHLSNGSEEELGWPGLVLCSIILPKLLVLDRPASRVLLTSTIEYCKNHQRAAVYALLLPLILRAEGINNPICDVIAKIIRECLHPAHVSAFCQRLLCGEEEMRKFICHDCHECLISNELVWTESLFNLFQSILNNNVHLSQDSIDHLVQKVQELAERFSNSLKFGNFLLCLVSKNSTSLKFHKLSLTEAVARTNTILTKSILSKLASL